MDFNSGNPFLGKDNPYLQGLIDSSLQDTARNYNLTVKPQMESAMARSGSFGNSGLQQMQQAQQSDLMRNMGTQANNLRAADYNNQQNMYRWDQDFNRGLFNDAFSQNQQNLQNFMGLLSTGNQFNQQDQANATSIQNAPLNYFGQFNNMANAIGGQGGTSTGTQSQPGSPLMGALGGWQLGGAVGSTKSDPYSSWLKFGSSGD